MKVMAPYNRRIDLCCWAALLEDLAYVAPCFWGALSLFSGHLVAFKCLWALPFMAFCGHMQMSFTAALNMLDNLQVICI